jgi:hypothetical protein
MGTEDGMARTASCHCGALVVRCEGEPTKVSLCHCLACQRRTGSTHSIAAFFPRASVSVEGETRTFTRPSDRGFDVTFHFCPTCGANLYWAPARTPDRIGVAVGAFADPSFPAPSQAVHSESRHPWLSLPV